MPAVARIGDPVSCGDKMAEGSGNVFSNGMPISRFGTDHTAGHCYNPVVMSSYVGAGNVFVNNIPIELVGDSFPRHDCGDSDHGGAITNGSPDVFANE